MHVVAFQPRLSATLWKDCILLPSQAPQGLLTEHPHYGPESGNSRLKRALLNEQGNLEIKINPAFEADLKSYSSLLTATQERLLSPFINRIGRFIRTTGLLREKAPSLAITVVAVSGHQEGQEPRASALLGEGWVCSDWKNDGHGVGRVLSSSQYLQS